MALVLKLRNVFSDTTIPTIEDLIAGVEVPEEDSLEDEYGTLLYRMKSKFVGDGVSKVLNTRIKLYDSEKNWTIVTKFSDSLSSPGGYPATIMSCSADSIGGLRIRKTSSNPWYDVNLGSGGFPSNAGGMSDNESGKSIVIIRKTGGNYYFVRNGVVAYGGELGYPIGSTFFDSYLTLGANPSGGSFNRFTVCEVDLLNVYNAPLSTEDIQEIYSKIVNGTYN
jgi:hypothetical protein